MVRRLKKEPREGCVAFEDFVALPSSERRKKAGRPKPLSAPDFRRLLIETNQLKDLRGWSDFTPRNFVALYCLLHMHVYSVLPEEVRDSFRLVVNAAKRMLEIEFSNNKTRMIEFMRWSWQREAKRLKYRDPENDFRIGWRLQFGRALLSDFRVARARKGKRVQ